MSAIYTPHFGCGHARPPNSRVVRSGWLNPIGVLAAWQVANIKFGR